MIPDAVAGGTPASYALVSAAVAPLSLIGGWTLAAHRTPDFDSWTGTISALASVGAPAAGLMTTAIAITGACHCVTSLGLRGAAPLGRGLLLAGGVATIGVAAFPLPNPTGSSAAHGLAALSSFVLMTVWPACAASPRLGLRNGYARAVSSGLAALLLAFGVAMATGVAVGATERVLAGCLSATPLLFVVAGRRRARSLRAAA